MNPQKINNSTIRITKTVEEDIDYNSLVDKKNILTIDLNEIQGKIDEIDALLAQCEQIGVDGKEEVVVE